MSRFVIKVACLCIGAGSIEAATWYVAPTGSDAANGQSWATAKQTIQAGVDAANSGDTVLVTNGSYATGGRAAGGGHTLNNRVVVDKPITVRSVNGPEHTRIAGAWHSAATNIGPAAVRGVWITNGSTLVGFTVTNGTTMGSYSVDGCGGGVWCHGQGTAPMISNCVIAGSQAYWKGGGVNYGYLYNCQIYNNSVAYGDGGGAYFSLLTDCILAGNSAYDGGGGAWMTAERCAFIGNTARNAGGGTWESSLYHCTLTSNTAPVGAGVCYGTLYSSRLVGNTAASFGGGNYGGTLYNCTLIGNSAGLISGGAHGGTLYNCIVWSNAAPTNANWREFSGAPSITNTCTTPLPIGAGNITNDPLFVNAAAGDYQLQPGSPCINTGTNEGWMFTAVDLAGHPRVVGGIVDMGAYEYSPLVAPSGIAATFLGLDQVRICWETVAAASGYVVWRSLLNDAGTAGAVGQTSETCFTETVPARQNYYYWVAATNGYGASIISGAGALASASGAMTWMDLLLGEP